jgi:hypothetical protein
MQHVSALQGNHQVAIIIKNILRILYVAKEFIVKN